MSNAAIFLHPDGYDTAGKPLVGRRSAGESFLRGFLRHADVERFVFWNVAGRPQAELEALVARIEPPVRPVAWIGRTERGRLAEVGVLNLPGPSIDEEAWLRRAIGSNLSLTGITHTTATARTMRTIGDLLVAPLEDHDALICTSSAVRQSVEAQLDLMRGYLEDLHGPRRRPEPQRVTIPLGLNAEDFAPAPEHRRRWRDELGIPDDAIAALYVGRFSVRTKMNPALMAMALERAAQRTDKAVYWVNAGWLEFEGAEEAFHRELAALCPSVQYRHVDGRRADARFSIWSVADLFISLPDNIQETFGLTPIEAMAAGLPSVISDWNGYKDTVRHGLDGFRIPTVAPRQGFGRDLAYHYANRWISYENYVGATAQYVAVDLARAEEALLRLVEDPELRRVMGDQAQRRAKAVFDWSAIIPQYQALWAEQGARRAAGAAAGPRADPYHPDPYALFANYPSRHISRADLVSLAPGMDAPAAAARLDGPLAGYSAFNRPTPDEFAAVLAHLAEHGPTPVARLRELAPPGRQNLLERGLLYLARYDVVVLTPTDA